MRLLIILAALCLSAVTVKAQQKDLTTYLQACKTGDQITAKNYAFGQPCKFSLSAFNYLSGGLFHTDQAAVNGFKAKVALTVNNTEVQKTAILYFDHKQGHWAVFNLFDASDIEKKYQQVKEAIEKQNFYADKEIVFSDMATWAIAAGQLATAHKYIGMAYVAAQENGNADFDTSFIDNVLNALETK